MVGNIESDLKSKLKPYFLNKNIIFKRHVKQKELNKLYNYSHIFVSSSLEKVWRGSTHIACGLPLICTTNSGGAEY